MSPLRSPQAKLLARALLWLALAGAIALAFGDSLVRAAELIVLTIVIGLLVDAGRSRLRRGR